MTKFIRTDLDGHRINFGGGVIVDHDGITVSDGDAVTMAATAATLGIDVTVTDSAPGAVATPVPAQFAPLASQTTVGAAGGASVLPATPTKYLKVVSNGVTYVVPAYAAS